MKFPFLEAPPLYGRRLHKENPERTGIDVLEEEIFQPSKKS
jgi:hypothetical protein